MVRKSVEVEIAGEQYPMNFSMGAVKKLTNKYGSIKKFGKTFEGVFGEDTEDESQDNGELENALFEMVWVLSVLIEQGCKLRKTVTGEEIKPLTEDELLAVVDMNDMKRIFPKILEAIKGDSAREVEVKPSKKEASAE